MKGVDYCFIIHDISKSGVLNFLENSVLDDRRYNKMHVKEINIKNHVCNCYFNNSIEAKKLETKNILIDEGSYQELSTRYVHNKSIKMLGLHYDELIGTIDKMKEKVI